MLQTIHVAVYRDADDTHGATRSDRRKLVTQIGGRFTARFFPLALRRDGPHRLLPPLRGLRQSPHESSRVATPVRCDALAFPQAVDTLAVETKDGVINLPLPLSRRQSSQPCEACADRRKGESINGGAARPSTGPLAPNRGPRPHDRVRARHMNEQPLFLGLLETVGNQAYIFATNRLRENVGASQRVWEAGVEFTYRAAKEVTRCAGFDALRRAAGEGPVCYAKAIEQAPRLGVGGVEIEVVLATSGKALFLARERSKAEDLIAAATRMALEKAPGLTLRGAVVEIRGHDAKAANAAVKAVHEEIETIRDRLPAPELRFPTLPILEPCASSGLPAARIYGPEPKPSSDVTIAKREAHEAAVTRISKLVGRAPKELGENIGEMEKKVDWLGIVHADGNGMGQLFMEFGELCEGNGLRDYFDAYRKLSLSLDLCGVAAFQDALKEIYPPSEGDSRSPVEVGGGTPDEGSQDGKQPEDGETERIPLLPLVLGGDDLTVLCDGRIAVRFAAAYLREFRAWTMRPEVLGHCSSLPGVLKNKRCLEEEQPPENGSRSTPGDDWTALGAAAGIAITKPHYPFHRGYELAESLLKEAKTAKTEVGVSHCALDFHVLFDGAETSLEDLRERWTLTDGHVLTARPYVVSDLGKRGSEGEDGEGIHEPHPAPEPSPDGDQRNESDEDHNEESKTNPWARNRRWEDLKQAAEALSRRRHRDSDQPGSLPRSQQYALRAALFRGAGAADRQLALIQHRYPKFPWHLVVHEACEQSPSLFFPINGQHRACRLLDALELADLGTEDAP